jgi:hypothetical protein
MPAALEDSFHQFSPDQPEVIITYVYGQLLAATMWPDFTLIR